MKNRIILSLLMLFAFVCNVYADAITDRAISKISRDTRTYISSDSRGATEQEAYDKALEELSHKISSFVNEEMGDSPDAVYLHDVESLYQRLDSHISDNRYRVFLYVKKSDLKPLGSSSNSMMMARTEDKTYEMVSAKAPETVIVRDTITLVQEVKVPINPVVSFLVGIKDSESFSSALIQLRKDNKVSAAAAFPIANIDDFYVAVIRNGKVIIIMHVDNGRWIDVKNGEEVDPRDYPSCSAYWFTVSKD